MSRQDFTIVERGTGAPVVVVPGIQGRWEYSRGLVDELSRFYRVITFSLWDERRQATDAAQANIDVFSAQVDAALDRAQVESARIVGVSFGGLVALRYAATRRRRTSALVMISAPGPQWHLRARHDLYARIPWVFGPLFLIESPFRLRREIRTALPEGPARRRYLREQLRTVATAPLSVSRMAARARLIASYDRVSDCREVRSKTLVVQGDPALDHVTGSGGTAEYATLIHGARLVTMEQTGHLGSVTRAGDCAAIIRQFLSDVEKDSQHSAA